MSVGFGMDHQLTPVSPTTRTRETRECIPIGRDDRRTGERKAHILLCIVILGFCGKCAGLDAHNGQRMDRR